MGLWQDMKQRRITQIVITYLAAGWVVLAGVDQLADRGVVSELLYRLALLAYGAGFLVTLVLGWYHGEKGRQKATLFEIALLGVIGISTVVAGARVVTAYRSQQEVASALADMESRFDLRRLAVLYFDRQGQDADLAAVADGLTEDLIARLSRVRDLEVVSEGGAARYRDSELPVSTIAEELEVGTVVTGAVRSEPGGFRVVVRLVDGDSGAEISEASFEGTVDDLLELREILAREISQNLRAVLGEEIRLRETRRETESVTAWVVLQRAERTMDEAEAALAHEDLEGALEALARADSLFARAGRQDPSWPEPVVGRGWAAYERSWLAETPAGAGELLGVAVERANEAMEMDARYGDAHELRGTARYRRWLLQLGSAREREALLEDARTDLERALDLDPRLASAHSTLSHLLYQTGDVSLAVIAARQAYETDAYLRAVDGVLYRLFWTNYDLEQPAQAEEWCMEGYRRFPEDFRFVECQLWLMTMEGTPADPELAWELLDEMDPLIPEPLHEFYYAGARMIVGGVLARAGMPDSARSVLAEARVGPGVDPTLELASVEAIMRILLGDEDEAVSLLQRYVSANPGHFGADAGLHWWWRPLAGNPEFRRLRGL